MSRQAQLALLVLIVGLAVVFGLRQAKPQTVTAPTVFGVPASHLQGSLIVPRLEPNSVLMASVSGEVVATTKPNKDGTYRLELPNQIAEALVPLENLSLPNGTGRLRGGASVFGAEVKLAVFADTNGNTAFDPGEASNEVVPFKTKTDPAMQAFFRYKLVVLSGQAELVENQDSDTGAKSFYRYNLRLGAGYHVLEGEFASNGYEIREFAGNTVDLVPPRGSAGQPSQGGFTPQ